MKIDKNITRENIAQTLHDEFGLTKAMILKENAMPRPIHHANRRIQENTH